jgi:cytochrome P450
VTTATAISFNPADARHCADPHPLLHRMREQAPVFRHVGPGDRAMWYLTRYDDVQRALHHPDIARGLDRLPADMAAVHRQWEFDPLAMVRRNVFHLDPPDHTRLRRLIAPAFGPRQVAAIDEGIHRFVDELLDGVAAADDPVDLIEALALPLPSVVVAELIGFPVSDRDRLRRWSDEMTRSRDARRVRRAGLEFIAYVESTLKQRRTEPGEDLLSQLLRAEQSDAMNHAELISSVFQLLLAGDETTVNLIGNGVLELLRHPDQLGLLRARPDLIDSAVEEMIRFNGPVGHAKMSYALTDIDFGRTVVPRGDIVVPMLLAANRDPAAFDDPDVFDITRDPNRHLGFGHGIHFCLGAALARRQARAAIGGVVHRFPDLALAVEPDDLQWTPDLFLHGLRSLPVHVRRVP